MISSPPHQSSGTYKTSLKSSFNVKYPELTEWSKHASHLLHGVFSSSYQRIVAISSDGAHVAQYIDQRKAIEIWDVATMECLVVLQGLFCLPYKATSPATFSHDGNSIIVPSFPSVRSEDLSIGLWSTKTGKNLQTSVLPLNNYLLLPISHIICSHTHAMIVVVDSQFFQSERCHKLVFCDVNNRRPSQVARAPWCGSDQCSELISFSPDDTLVAFGCHMGIFLFASNSGQYLAKFDKDYSPRPPKFHASDLRSVCILSVSGKVHLLPVDLIPTTVLFAIYADTKQHNYYISNEGCVFDTGKRICWVPTNCIPIGQLQVSWGHKLTAVTKYGIMIMDFSRTCNICQS